MKPPTSSLNKHRLRSKPPVRTVQFQFPDPAEAAWVDELVALLREPRDPDNYRLAWMQNMARVFFDIAPDEETLKYAVPDADLTAAEAWGFAAILRNQMVRRINYIDAALIVLGESMGELDDERVEIANNMPDAPEEVPNA